MTMKKILSLALLSVAVSGGAAPVPIFINDTPLILPGAGLSTINTVAFVNQSSISASAATFSFSFGAGSFGFSAAGALPFETFNTLYFTNEASGVMSGSPGFRFLTTKGHTRVPAKVFVNEGSITTSGYLEIKADQIVNTGPLDSGAPGLIRITGKDVDVTRSRLRTGPGFATFYFGGQNDSPRRGQYQNAFGVTDAYWGVGSNGTFLGTGPTTRLNAGSPNFNMPFPSSALHQNQLFSGNRLATNRVSLPKFSFFGTNFFSISNFAAFAWTNNVDGTAAMVQVVFVRTNSDDGQLSTEVRFSPNGFDTQGPFEVTGPAQAMVELKRWDFDPSLDLYVTNTFYVVDSMAVKTNLNLYRNTGIGARGNRPNVYEFLLSQPNNWFGGVPGNTVFTNGLLDTGYLSNRVNMAYAGYSANVFTNVFTSLANGFGFVSGAIQPTNQPGRIELYGDKLNLDSTRIRSESTVFIKTKDLAGNKFARLVDAPLAGFDLTSKQPELVLTNLVSPNVQRLSGTVCAWSGQWKNYQTRTVGTNTMTNEINFHVLFVDHSFQPTVPSQIFKLAVHATNVVIADQINLSPVGLFSFLDPIKGRSLLIDAVSLDVRGGLSLPFGSAWASTNIQRLLNFTNSGTILVPGAGKYGTDRATPYSSFINSGTNTAASQLVRSTRFVNSGCLIANAALVQIDAVTARIEGPPITITTNISSFLTFTNIGNTNFFVTGTNYFTNVFYSSFGAKVQSYSDIQIKAGTLSVSNSLLAAGGDNTSFFFPGRLIFSVTNRFVDAGADARNYWNCAGFEMRRRPATSSLLGTWISTTIGINALTTHVWPAQDLGAVAAGYTNNLAVGKLSINTSTSNGRAVFKPASGRQAMYVDYIELFNDATNFNRTIFVDPNLTIYFANANVPVEKLDGAVNGRFRWVPSFAGPLSTTNIIYPSGTSYAFNIALISSLDIDSNNNGIPNALDPYPIDVPGEMTSVVPRFVPAGSVAVVAPNLSLRVNDGKPPGAVLSWNAAPFSTYVIEFKNSFTDSGWEVLSRYVSGPAAEPVSVSDPITGPARMRLYRLRVVSTSER